MTNIFLKKFMKNLLKKYTIFFSRVNKYIFNFVSLLNIISYIFNFQNFEKYYLFKQKIKNFNKILFVKYIFFDSLNVERKVLRNSLRDMLALLHLE